MTVKLTAGTYAANTLETSTVTKVSTPTTGQNALTNVDAAASNDLSASAVVLLDTSTLEHFHK